MTDGAQSPGLFRRAVRWVPPLALAFLLASAWGAFFAGGVAAVVGFALLIAGAPLLGLPALLVTGIYAAVRRRRSAPVVMTLALGLLSLWPAAWPLGFGQLPFPGSPEKTTPPATIRLPFDAPTRVLWGGDRLSANYHRYVPDQKWAYDLGVEPVMSGSSKLEDYGCYGIPVLAPAAGRVAAARDGEPDATPGELSNNTKAPTGNFVALELSTGTYLVLAHLKPGSLRVRPGDSVTEGQELGQCGNSGNTSEPHLHLHHQRQNPDKVPPGFAEGLPLYFRDHDGAPMPEGGIEEREGKAVAVGATVRHLGGAAR